ncbi:zinc finger CCCH domain-containing protein 17-like isoform X2 [Carex rostrata]
MGDQQSSSEFGLQTHINMEIMLNGITCAPGIETARVVQGRDGQPLAAPRIAELECTIITTDSHFIKSNEGKNSFNELRIHHIPDSRNPYGEPILISEESTDTVVDHNSISHVALGDASASYRVVFSFDHLQRSGNSSGEALMLKLIPHMIFAGTVNKNGENTGRLNGGVGTGQGDKPCKHLLSGSCPYNDRFRCSHSGFIGGEFYLMTTLKGHQQAISAIAPSGSDKLFSGSKDGTVKMWDCHTGQCVTTFGMGGEVGCMISDGPCLFVGIPKSIILWNTQTSAQMSLSGPMGQVYVLVAANNMLFAGTKDGKIFVWRFRAQTNCFEPPVSLIGHCGAVIALVVGGTKLYSGSMDHTIKAWDLTTLQCVQTIPDHTNAVMSLLLWGPFLISCSLDNTVKFWSTNNEEQLEVTHTHNEEHGVLALCGINDLKGKSVLLCSLNDNTVRLYDLPSFNEMGRIFAKQEVRTMQTGPCGIFFTGDGTGVKVWKWSA